MQNDTEYVPHSEVLRHANKLRISLGLAPFKRKDISGILSARKIPCKKKGCRYKLYHLQSALASLTCLRNNGKLAWNRNGTKEEVESREYMPLTIACNVFRCSRIRFDGAIKKLNLKAWRHPHTNRLWVNIKQAEQVAYYRKEAFIRSVLPKQEADFIIATRPFRFVNAKSFGKFRRYYVPELSHIGSIRTGWNE